IKNIVNQANAKRFSTCISPDCRLQLLCLVLLQNFRNNNCWEKPDIFKQFMKRHHFLLSSLALLFTTQVLEAQIRTQPYSYQHYQKYDRFLYSPETRIHTASKPFLLKGDLLTKMDSVQSLNQVGSDNIFMRKIFNEHLVEVEKEDHTFFLDFLPDCMIGKEVIGSDKRTTWLNTTGFQGGLTIKDKFTFYANPFENQVVCADYLTDYVNQNHVMPGQGIVKHQANNEKDWMYATASLTYDFSDYFQTTLAYDKNHIGDGYRSLLLSDFSSNYANLKLTGTIGNVQYTSIWAYMTDPKNPRVDSLNAGGRFGDGIKWGAFQYLDYNATKRL